MYLDYIEIGTSDFDTLVQKTDCARPYSTYKNEIDNLVKTILK